MSTSAPPPEKLSPEACAKSVLAWVRLAQGRNPADLPEQLLRQLQLLQETPLPVIQCGQLLDLLFALAERAVAAESPHLREISLPIPRKLRLRSRHLLDTLDAFARSYLALLPQLPTPTGEAPPGPLRHALLALAWQIRISHLIAAPPRLGIWQSLHAAFMLARHQGVEKQPGPKGSASIQRIYTNTLLIGIAQPASFSSSELEFICDYIETCLPPVELSTTPPADTASVFWIDPGKDYPAQSMTRRTPGAEADILYFSCAAVADHALRQRTLLAEGTTPHFLGLPEFAGSRTGPGILKRLHLLWGKPVKRRFPRRRQSYRIHLHIGLEDIGQLLAHPGHPSPHSEWMVTNESPDGYALMHIAGDTAELRVGDIVALEPMPETPQAKQARYIGIIRWAISDNPEHIEIGLQVLAPRAIAAAIATPEDPAAPRISALILPAMPPLRPLRSLVVETGLIEPHTARQVVLSQGEKPQAHMLQTGDLDEQTGNIEIFSVLPDR